VNVGRYRNIEVADMPIWVAAPLGVGLLVVFFGVMWFLLRLDHTKLRDPRARARAERRKESQKRQSRLRARRQALQRRAARRGTTD
jgi:hypothetical protein